MEIGKEEMEIIHELIFYNRRNLVFHPSVEQNKILRRLENKIERELEDE